MEETSNSPEEDKPIELPRLAEYHFLQKIHWQLFGTLTFRRDVIETRRIWMAAAFLRKLAKSKKIYCPDILWCLREEGGYRPADKLPHFHFTIAGVPEQAVCATWCQQLQTLWESLGGGMARIRPYDHALNGVGYILKCSGEKSSDSRTDSAVFKHPDKLMLSNSALAWLKRRS